METKKYRFDEVTINFDKKRIPLSSAQREKRQGMFRYYGAQGVIDHVDDYIFEGTYLLIAEDGENLKSKKQNIAQVVDGQFWVNNHAHIVQGNEQCDTRFLCYLINSMDLSGYITGSAQPKLSQANLNAVTLSLPTLAEQKRIVEYLYMLDQKIDVNRQINDNLADLLQTIYQDRFGNDILAVNQGVLSDICSYSRDKVAVSELNVSTYFSTENMLSEKAGSTEATSLPTTSQTTACHKGDTLISNIRPYFKKIVYCEGNCGCSTDVLCFTPSQPRYSTYLFSTLYADKFFAFMVAGSKGTKMPRGDKQQIMTYPVVLPSEEELAGFNTIASPLLKQIYSNRAENKRLSILRDTLLPKLMSGEIDVSAVQLYAAQLSCIFLLRSALRLST